jgi:hypothetical protein
MRAKFHRAWTALCLFPAALAAGPIAVQNFSFETPNVIDSSGIGVVGSGWLTGPANGSTANIFDPTNFHFPGATGNNAPLPGTANGGQCLEIFVGLDKPEIIWVYPDAPVGTIAPNSRYVLTVAVGQGLPGDTSNAILSLLAGTTVVGSTTINGDDIPRGTFKDFSASFIAPTGSELVGMPLNLELRADRAGRPLRPPPGEQPLFIFFDNVRLSSEAVPEPAIMPILILAGAAAFGRRRQFRDPN